MSYCRWSSDDYQCDIYAYEADEGFEIHVASRRRTPKEPFPKPVSFIDDEFDVWFARNEAVAAMVNAAAAEPIGLRHDGERFRFVTPGEAADELERLRGVGYNVPQYAIDTLREEQAELG
jgi:hypothetical protein